VTVAVTVCGPAALPGHQMLLAAMPFAPVDTVWLVACCGTLPPIFPSPLVTTNVTLAPFTGTPAPSFTTTVRGPQKKRLPSATWLSPLTIVIVAGAAPPVAAKVTVGRALAVAVSVFVPGVAPSVQFPTVAMPLAFVIAVAPVTDPPPEATANVALTPATGFPA
jgi:hypothetical protein